MTTRHDPVATNHVFIFWVLILGPTAWGAFCAPLRGTEYTVNSAAGLTAKLANAQPGNMLVWTNGTYINPGAIKFHRTKGNIFQGTSLGMTQPTGVAVTNPKLVEDAASSYRPGLTSAPR